MITIVKVILNIVAVAGLAGCGSSSNDSNIIFEETKTFYAKDYSTTIDYISAVSAYEMTKAVECAKYDNSGIFETKPKQGDGSVEITAICNKAK